MKKQTKIKVPTAIELCDKMEKKACHPQWAIDFAIEFARLHCEAQRQAIMKSGYKLGKSLSNEWDMDGEIIMTAYPSSKIK